MKKNYIFTSIAILCFFGLFAQVPTDGLVAYYPLNGNFNDIAGSGYNGSAMYSGRGKGPV